MLNENHLSAPINRLSNEYILPNSTYIMIKFIIYLVLNIILMKQKIKKFYFKKNIIQ